MKIIKSTPNPSGAYPSPQPWNGTTPPDGWLEITTDTTEFYNGFVTLTITDGVVTAISENVEAHKAWTDAEAAKPKLVESDPIAEHDELIAMLTEKVTNLELGITT